MWSPDRRLLLALLALAGCGFTPAYGPGGPGGALRGRVRLSAPATLDDAALEDALRARLGAEGAEFLLETSLRLADLPQATATDGRVLRSERTATARYRLTRGGAEVASGEVSGMASFGVAGSPVAGLAGEEAARQRLAAMLADRIVAQLLAALVQ